jgi:hypothetical protein
MSKHSGPDFYVPDEEKCEAIVKGIRGYVFEWQRIDHRCPRRANQGRNGHVVCHIHARSKEVNFKGGNNGTT